MASKLSRERFKCPAGTRIIVRYPNRKFYDTETSSYVTLAQMQAMAAQGDRLRVYVREPRRCITTQTLCQIIAQAGKSGAPFNDDALMGLLQSLPPAAAVTTR